MWGPIIITILAASGNNIGKVLQKQATRTLPKLIMKREVIYEYLQSKTWVTGMLTDLGGALLMIAAFAGAPPVSAIGLVVLLIFSHFYLKERLKAREWIAAAVAGIGVLGLGASSEPDHLQHPDISGVRIVTVFSVMVLLLAVECWWRQRLIQNSTKKSASTSQSGPSLNHPTASMQASHQSANTTSSDAIFCGLEAGACFGYSAAACRTGFILANKVSVLCAPLGLGASVMLTTTGFVLQTRGLKSGNTVVVCTMAAVSSMVSGVLAGLLALDEKMPSTPMLQTLRIASWCCILLGVTSLAGGQDGLWAILRLLPLKPFFTPPQWARRFIPRPLALMMTKAHKRLEVPSLPTNYARYELAYKPRPYLAAITPSHVQLAYQLRQVDLLAVWAMLWPSLDDESKKAGRLVCKEVKKQSDELVRHLKVEDNMIKYKHYNSEDLQAAAARWPNVTTLTLHPFPQLGEELASARFSHQPGEQPAPLGQDALVQKVTGALSFRHLTEVTVLMSLNLQDLTPPATAAKPRHPPVYPLLPQALFPQSSNLQDLTPLLQLPSPTPLSTHCCRSLFTC
eukprot:gene31634-6828_t